jgi:hypothetical protein
MENPEKIAKSVGKQSGSLNQKISVAPMMDWTDWFQTTFRSNALRTLKNCGS